MPDLPPVALTLAQSTATPSLMSVGGVVLATFLLVAIIKRLVPELKGRWTLGVSLVIACLLTAVALFVTKTLPEEPVTAFLAVLMAVAGAAGIDVGGATVLKGATKVLAPVALVLVVGGCSGVPATLIEQHVATAGKDHLERVRSDPEATPAVIETWEEHWRALGEAAESAKGGL